VNNLCEGRAVTATADLTTEQYISLAEAARRLPPFRLGRPVSTATIWRWCREGVTLPSGEVVRLECFRIGARWLTSVEALSRFIHRQNPGLASAEEAPHE
jgi:hypothetical protein